MIPSFCFSTHIVGAELYYECINPQTRTYRIYLKMLRDCKTGEAPFDPEISLFFFRSNGMIDQMVTAYMPANTPQIVPENWNACVATPYNICVEEAVYETVVVLPDIIGGYNVGWARCCRNGNITNLFNPLDIGVTFIAHIPKTPDGSCNSMPYFNKQLPVFTCTGLTLEFDHSATDPDGDSLVYALTHPYDGINTNGIGAVPSNTTGSPIVSSSNPMGPPPYQLVPFQSGYSAANPFGPGSTASIDPQTGWLSITPANAGVYVIAISVFEYRNGVLLSENKKDLQIHVINCIPQDQPPVISHQFNAAPPGISYSGDTIIALANAPFCYTTTLSDSVVKGSLVLEPASLISNPVPPAPTVTYSGSNPVEANICWEPACDYAGQLIPFVFKGKDDGDCPLYNQLYDTIWIRIVEPPAAPPEVQHDLSLVPSSGDTIFLEPDSSGCFYWTVTDTLYDTLNYQPLNASVSIQPISGSAAGFNIQSSTSGTDDSLSVYTCVEPGCEAAGGLFRMILTGTDQALCPPDGMASDSIYIRVDFAPNPPPQIYHDLSGNVFNQDTIIIDVHDTLCYDFVINDTFPSASIFYQLEAEPLSGTFSGSSPVINFTSTQDSLSGSICWRPDCNHINGVYRLIISGWQENQCEISDTIRDTVFVRINPVFNPPPAISHQFIPGYQLNGDTIVLAADSAGCFRFRLEDPVSPAYLDLDANAYLYPTQTVTSGISINIDTSSGNLISGELCFDPACRFTDQLILIELTGTDSFDCDLSNAVRDSVWIRIVDPVNQPPVISHDLSGLMLNNGMVEFEAGVGGCYDLLLEDPDSVFAGLVAAGENNIFATDFGSGNPAEITFSGSNPLVMRVCWNPSCHEAPDDFEIVVCGRDTSRCGLTPEVCDTVRIHVNPCNLTIQNVFTPNGDGINDFFQPFDLAGVTSFKFLIFDRWGNEIYASAENGKWDGKNKNGKDMNAGVYYWVVEWEYYSAQGEKLFEKEAGNVSLFK